MTKLLTFLFAIPTLTLISKGIEVVTWYDLGIIEQIRLIFGLCFITAVGIIGVFIFKSVWIKNGYAGLDKILEGKEVSLFVAHVIALLSFMAFFFFALFYRYNPVPDYVFVICAGGFISPEIVHIVNFFMEKYKNKKE